MQLVQDAQSDGTVGDNKLEDNEEALNNEAITIRFRPTSARLQIDW